jgi:hypothetical protein
VFILILAVVSVTDNKFILVTGGSVSVTVIGLTVISTYFVSELAHLLFFTTLIFQTHLVNIQDLVLINQVSLTSSKTHHHSTIEQLNHCHKFRL